jgi:hypothetical protein
MSLRRGKAESHAQSAAMGHPVSTEVEAILFVQSPQADNGKGAIRLVWIPQPIQRLCLGKTAQQCSAIDYCIRTTTRDVTMCHNLGIPLSRLPSYPNDTSPRRQLSVIYFPVAPMKGFAMLQNFYHRTPRTSFQRLGLSTRVKARVRFTRTSEDDDFDVLEILAVAPSDRSFCYTRLHAFRSIAAPCSSIPLVPGG